MTFIKKIKRKDGKIYGIEVKGYRDKDGKVKHKYIRYVGKLDKKGNVVSSKSDISLDKVFQFGFPSIVSKAIDELNLKDMLRDYKEDIATILMMQTYRPSSIRKMMARIGSIEPSLIKSELPMSRERIESALDFLEENKEIIEQRLYDNLKEKCDDDTLFYDITAIALNGYVSSLAKIGYPEFAPQINIGFCVERKYGFPIFHEVFRGNISQKETLLQVVEKLRKFGRKKLVLVFDGGIFCDKTVENAVNSKDMKVDVIARMQMYDSIKKIAIENVTKSVRDVVSLSNSKVYVKEISYKKGKMLVCFNEKLKVSVKEKRYDEVRMAIEKKKEGKPVKEGLKKYLIRYGKEWKINYEKLEEAEKYDGIFVLYCSMADMPKENAVKAYFEKDRIEKSFCTMKSILGAEPLRFQLDKRIRACLMVSHLKYLLAMHIETRLKENGLKYTIESVRENMSNVCSAHILQKGKTLKRISSLTEEQKKIINIFDVVINLAES
ncbi:MAG: hypothetical protein KKD63_16130 [Proteobacteria bacterium]|nr:hypothetical protein [Pseudomonadota bacterium]